MGAPCWSAEKDAKAAGNDPRGLAGTRHAADARVIYPNRALDPSIQAELEPGPFTIPEGYKAVDLKFHHVDPKTDYKSTTLRPSNIKCVKSKRPPSKADFKPGLELPAGEYLLIVGGMPGAVGTLNYTLVPDAASTPKDRKPEDGRDEKSPEPLTKRVKELVDRGWQPPKGSSPESGGGAVPVISPNCTIEMLLTYSAVPSEGGDVITLEVRDGKVTGNLRETTWPAAGDEKGTWRWQRDADKETGRFEGTLQGNRISGTAKYRAGPQNIRTWERGRLTHHVVVVSTNEGPQHFDLRADGTLSWDETLRRKNHNRWLAGAGRDGMTDYVDDMESGPQHGPYFGVWRIRK